MTGLQMMSLMKSLLLLMPLMVAATPLFAEDAAVSTSAELALHADDYRSALVGRDSKELQLIAADQQRQRDLALDLHSDSVLARRAEAQGLDQDPAVLAQLAHVRRQVLVRALMSTLIDEQAADLATVDALARERYASQKDKLKSAEQRRVDHILLTDNGDCACNGEASAMERAVALRAELLSGERDFSEAAKELSKDRGSASRGGRLPVMERNGQMVPEFEAAVFSLKAAGDISEPVKTKFGVHLIRLVEIVPERQLSFDDVKAGLYKQIQSDRVSSITQATRSDAYPDVNTLNLEALRMVAEQILDERGDVAAQ